MSELLTAAQEEDLKRRLLERGRKLVAVYLDRRNRLWAVSRPTGSNNPRSDLQHELLLTEYGCLIRVTHYPGGVLGPD